MVLLAHLGAAAKAHLATGGGRHFYLWYVGAFHSEPPWIAQMHHFTIMPLLMQSLRSAPLYAPVPAATETSLFIYLNYRQILEILVDI